MALTAAQNSTIYFQRYKRSKARAALFRQFRASPANDRRNLTQPTFADLNRTQVLPSGQRLLRGFNS
jgi:hypothetical protein